MPRVLEKYNMKDLGSARAIKILMQENASLKNALPTAHISTTSTQLTDSAEDLPIEHVKIKGATSQVQYEGKNKLDSSKIQQTTKNGVTCTYNPEDDSVTFDGECTTDNTTIPFLNSSISALTAKTTMTVVYVSGSVENSAMARLYNTDWSKSLSLDISDLSLSNNKKSQTYNQATETTFVNNGFRFEQGTVLNNFKIKVMVTETVDTDYEPYVGGQPAPNPAYPQTIHRVTGECNEKVVNRNLFDKDNANILDAYLPENTIASVSNRKMLYITCNPNTTYTIQKKVRNKWKCFSSRNNQ